jgi:hypothetical protein
MLKSAENRCRSPANGTGICVMIVEIIRSLKSSRFHREFTNKWGYVACCFLKCLLYINSVYLYQNTLDNVFCRIARKKRKGNEKRLQVKQFDKSNAI